MSSRKRNRESKPGVAVASPLERLPYGLISSFILPYLNDVDVKNASQINITEIREYAYRHALWDINEVTAENRGFIQRVREVTKLLQVKSMNKLIELHYSTHYFFNDPLEKGGVKLLPDGLRTLTLGTYFNEPLEKDGMKLLPDSLQTLTFGQYFNRPLEFNGQRLLPDSLQTLTLGQYFNHPLEFNGQRLLPDGLQTLVRLRYGDYQ